MISYFYCLFSSRVSVAGAIVIALNTFLEILRLVIAIRSVVGQEMRRLSRWSCHQLGLEEELARTSLFTVGATLVFG